MAQHVKEVSMTGLACPECRQSLHTPMLLGERIIKIRPATGEMTICLRCSSVLAFEGQPLSVRLADASDLAALDDDTLDRLQLARIAVQTYRHQHTP
jgi:hypothetical protein